MGLITGILRFKAYKGIFNFVRSLLMRRSSGNSEAYRR